MIDNFEQIKPLLKFEDENDFYFVQVLQRNKENPDLGKNNRLLKAYYINSLKKLDKYKPEMIKLAEVFNARIYIHLNRRNGKKIALEMMEDLAHCINSNQFELSKIYNSVCGRHHSEKDKTWVIDVDNNNSSKSLEDFVKEIRDVLYTIEPINRIRKIEAFIPTKNGMHLIVTPFNSQKFKEKYPNIEIHKNNPTILYIP